ncbi:MAG: MBL fold metallo-hydrolase [Patescibacteria group bacterium]
MLHFKIQKINKDIYLITEPFYREHANLWLLKGAAFDVLIDCGLGIFDVRKFLVKKGFNPKIVITHSHFDHAGGLRHFNQREMFTTGKIAKNLQRKELWGLEYLQQNDFVPPTLFKAFAMNKMEVKPCKPGYIDVGRFHFKVIELPGHTDDSIVLHDSKNKILISGDTLYAGKIYADMPNSNKKEFMASIKFIKTLDFELALPGHNEVLNRKQALSAIDKWLFMLKSAQ